MHGCIYALISRTDRHAFWLLQVDRAFSLYCTIDPLAQTLGINIYQFNQLIRDTDMADKTVGRARSRGVTGIELTFRCHCPVHCVACRVVGKAWNRGQAIAFLLLLLLLQSSAVTDDIPIRRTL